MTKNNKILIVGGAGYIGSHMAYLLADRSYQVTVFDHDYSSHKGRLPNKAKKIKGDLRDFDDICTTLLKGRYDLIMYFAGMIIAPESVVDPLKYYDHNVVGAVNLLRAASQAGTKKIIFSSTAAVYGNPRRVPIREDADLNPINPYGRTKLVFEHLLKDLAAADKDFSYIVLRYFNAAGAHPNGKAGECHQPETHLIPNILKGLTGDGPEVTIYGDDYPTRDGTCIRDYIHVCDLCEAHYLAIKALERGTKRDVFNLGSGKGFSVLEVIKAVEKVTRRKVNVTMAPRRAGDPAVLVASSAKAKKILGWTPKRGLEDIIRSAWAWERSR